MVFLRLGKRLSRFGREGNDDELLDDIVFVLLDEIVVDVVARLSDDIVVGFELFEYELNDENLLNPRLTDVAASLVFKNVG